MPASLLDSQLAALEVPHEAIEADCTEDPDRCAAQIAATLR
jgi:gluconate kinase